MELHFLWVIGLGLVLGWWIVDAWFLPEDFKPARSWYAVPVIGLAMCISWFFFQVAQTIS